MHYLDIIVLIVIIASAVEGGFHGFIYEVCSLIGLIAGFFLAAQFYAEAAAYIGFIPFPDWVLKVIAFLIILIVTNIVFRLLGKALREILRKVFMGWLDRLAGVVFGIVRGVIIVVLITIVLLISPFSSILRREAPDTKIMAPMIELAKPLFEMIAEKKPVHLDSI